MVEKIRPSAGIEYSFGNDGRDNKYCIRYRCPKCGKRIIENEIACDECGIFFDWKQKAHIEIRREIVWK